MRLSRIKKLTAGTVTSAFLLIVSSVPAHAGLITANGAPKFYSVGGAQSCSWKVHLLAPAPLATAVGDLTGIGGGGQPCTSVGVQVVALQNGVLLNGGQFFDGNVGCCAAGLWAVSSVGNGGTNPTPFGVNHWKFRLFVYSVLYQDCTLSTC
jgi:hypothetical protein